MVHCRVFVIFTVGLLLAGCGSSAMEPTDVAQPTSRALVADPLTTPTSTIIPRDIVLPIPIEAEELSKAFAEDATAAYEKYVGKLFGISGEVQDITDDNLSMYGPHNYSAPKIRCYFAGGVAEAVISAAQNHPIDLTLIGTVQGMKDDDIVVQDCRADEGMNTLAPTPTPTPTPTPRVTRTSQGLVEPREPAPNFTLKGYENDNYTKDQEVSLSELKGKPVVINFWFPACSQCQELMFLIKDSYNANKDHVHYIAVQVSADSKSEWDPRGSDATSGQDYVTDKELHFIIGPDVDRSIAAAYGVDAYPTTYFLDKDLNLVSMETYLKARGIRA